MKWLILTIISAFLVLCCGQMIGWDNQGNLIAYSYSVWGDWSAHLTFISSFLNRGISWINGDNPLFYGAPFQYPFLSQLLTALLAFFTRLDPIAVTLWSSLALLFFLPFTLFRFYRECGLGVRPSLVSGFLFLFMGGFQIFDSGLNPSEPLTNQFENGSFFTQFVLFEFFPQRAFLFGLITVLLLFTAYLKSLKKGPLSTLHLFLFSIGFALVAWFHLHSWIFVGALLLMLWEVKTGIVTLLISIPVIGFLLFHPNSNGESLKPLTLGGGLWLPGWAQHPSLNQTAAEQMNPLWFWIYNTGLCLPLVALGVFLNRQRLKALGFLFPLFLAGSTLFILALFIRFQPYFYDNLKLFTYALMGLIPLAALALEPLFQKKALIPLALAIIGIQSASAIHDHLFFTSQNQKAEFLKSDEMRLCESFQKIRSGPHDLVVIAPKHNHWVTTLCGSPVLMGYPGWLWSWGISYRQRELELETLALGKDGADEILNRYPLRYAIFHSLDTFNNMPVNLEFFKKRFKVILEEGPWFIFDLRITGSPTNL